MNAKLLILPAVLLLPACDREGGDAAVPKAVEVTEEPAIVGEPVVLPDDIGEIPGARRTPGEKLDHALQKTGEGLQTAGEKTEEGIRIAKEKTEAGLEKAAEKTGNILKRVGEEIENRAKHEGGE